MKKRKIEGTCLAPVMSEAATPAFVRGSEYCTQENMRTISGLIDVCGFTKVVSHNASIDLADGTNVLAIYNSAMARIVNGMRRPKSVIVAPVAVTGTQLDSVLKGSTIGLACKDATESEYRDKSGAVIVGCGKV